LTSLVAKIQDKVFYGWVVVGAGFIVSLMTYGVRYTFGVFFKSIESEFYLTRTVVSGIFSVHMVVASVCSVLGGWALDKYGPRKLMFLMGIFVGLSLFLTSQAGSWWHLYLSYSLLLGFGTAPVFTAVNATVSRWFDKKRGFALGISGGGNAAGTLVMAPFTSYLISTFDWRMAFIVLAGIALFVVSSLSLLLIKRPEDIGLLPDGIRPESAQRELDVTKGRTHADEFSLSEALRTGNFWFLTLIWLLLSSSVHLILTHIVPHAIDLGIAPMNAALIISLAGGASIFGRVIVGRLSDTIGRKIPAVICAILQFASFLGLIWVRELGVFYLVALATGFLWGGLSAQVTVLISDVFGVRSIGVLMGVIGVGWTLGAAIGPAVGGLAFDSTGEYSAAFLICAISMLFATLFAVLIRTERKHAEQFRDN
jgi:MFS family permease